MINYDNISDSFPRLQPPDHYNTEKSVGEGDRKWNYIVKLLRPGDREIKWPCDAMWTTNISIVPRIVKLYWDFDRAHPHKIREQWWDSKPTKWAVEHGWMGRNEITNLLWEFTWWPVLNDWNKCVTEVWRKMKQFPNPLIRIIIDDEDGELPSINIGPQDNEDYGDAFEDEEHEEDEGTFSENSSVDSFIQHLDSLHPFRLYPPTLFIHLPTCIVLVWCYLMNKERFEKTHYSITFRLIFVSIRSVDLFCYQRITNQGGQEIIFSNCQLK